MVEVGDVAMKIAGRDAGKLCAVVEVLDNNFVVVDGETRRKKCNVMHLEFLDKKMKLKKDASTEDVRKGLKDLGFAIKEVKKGKTKEKKVKLVRARKIKETPKTSKKK